MTTESEVKIARYKETIKISDAWGRIIGVQRLRPSESTKLAGMTPDLSGYEEMPNDKGVPVRIPHRMPLIVAASVRWIDDQPIPFPRNRAELDAIYDRLDVEGLDAAGTAFAKLNLTIKEDEEEVDPLAEAKNS